MNQEVYIVLSHIENTYQNEFIGIFSSVEKATTFCETMIEQAGAKLDYSKVTIHPISLDESFDYSFSEKTLVSFTKNNETGLLELVR
jgi:hypothetical protein